MIIRIDQTSPDPVYQQIRDQIVSAIARGELQPGVRLPSVRALASDLGINLHTVNKAYAVLRDEGHLLMRGRSGATVADFQQTATPERVAANAEKLSEELYRLALEHCAQGGSEQEFIGKALAQAQKAFADSGSAGAGREIGGPIADLEIPPLETSPLETHPSEEHPDATHPASVTEGA